MQALLELLHTCVGVFGCGCLDEDFWQPTLSRRRAGAAGHGSAAPPLHHPRPQATFRPGPGLGGGGSEDLLEGLLRTPPPEPALDAADAPALGGSGGSGGHLHRGASSSSEEMYRAGSFNTRVGVLRSASPFYRMQDVPEAQHSQHSQQQTAQQHASPGAGATAAAAAAAEGIELKPAAANVLLGQQHYEQRGKFVQAHPVARAHSPGRHHAHLNQAGGAVRRSVSPLQQHPVAVADDT